MGASKTYQHDPRTIDAALLGRGISHPARAEIYEILRDHGITKSRDLCPHLDLCHSAVHEHLLKMREAGIIHLEFEFKGSIITPIPDSMDRLIEFLSRGRR